MVEYLGSSKKPHGIGGHIINKWMTDDDGDTILGWSAGAKNARTISGSVGKNVTRGNCRQFSNFSEISFSLCCQKHKEERYSVDLHSIMGGSHFP